MSDIKEPLVRDLVAWCAREPRLYADVLEAWRTSCPRLTVWEDAVERGLLETRPGARDLMVAVTPRGHDLLTDAAMPPVAPARGPAMAIARS